MTREERLAATRVLFPTARWLHDDPCPVGAKVQHRRPYPGCTYGTILGVYEEPPRKMHPGCPSCMCVEPPIFEKPRWLVEWQGWWTSTDCSTTAYSETQPEWATRLVRSIEVPEDLVPFAEEP